MRRTKNWRAARYANPNGANKAIPVSGLLTAQGSWLFERARKAVQQDGCGRASAAEVIEWLVRWWDARQ